MRVRAAVAILTALVAGPVNGAAPTGGSLDAVRTTLRALAGTAPVAATLERFVSADRKDRPHTEGRVTLDVADGPGGLSITYPDTFVGQLLAERAEADPEKPKPAQNVMQGFDVADLAYALNRAQALLSDLDGAKILSETDTEWQGRKARLLDLELLIRVSKADSKWLKSQRWTMKLWVTPEGLPLASEDEVVFRAGFLFLNFDGSDATARRYTRAGDRLVVTQATNVFGGKGFGEEQHTRAETRLTLTGT